MAKTILIAIAVLAGGLGAGMAGDAVGSAPMLPRSTIAQLYQAHDSAPPPERGGMRPPEQYPLVTPGGVVPVTGLALRGLYSQARYLDPAPASAQDEAPGPAPTVVLPEDAPTLAEGSVSAPAAVPEREPALAAGIPGETPGGRARTIDVAAALAMR